MTSWRPYATTLQRLAPIYIAVALSWVTGYFVFTLGGIGLAIAIELAWPLLRPFFAVLYDELMAHYTQMQMQRRAALLKAFLPFFQAYKTVLTAYPHTMLTASAPEVAAQIEMCAEAIRGVKTLRSPEPDDPFAPPGEEPYEMVRTTSLPPRDFRDWSLRECRTWRQDLLAVLARGGSPCYDMPCSTLCMSAPGRSGNFTRRSRAGSGGRGGVHTAPLLLSPTGPDRSCRARASGDFAPPRLDQSQTGCNPT